MRQMAWRLPWLHQRSRTTNFTLYFIVHQEYIFVGNISFDVGFFFYKYSPLERCEDLHVLVCVIWSWSWANRYNSHLIKKNNLESLFLKTGMNICCAHSYFLLAKWISGLVFWCSIYNSNISGWLTASGIWYTLPYVHSLITGCHSWCAVYWRHDTGIMPPTSV